MRVVDLAPASGAAVVGEQLFADHVGVGGAAGGLALLQHHQHQQPVQAFPVAEGAAAERELTAQDGEVLVDRGCVCDVPGTVGELGGGTLAVVA